MHFTTICILAKEYIELIKSTNIMGPEPAESASAGSDIENKRLQLIRVNKRLRQGIVNFSRRQEMVEEMIEVEHGPEVMTRFVENRRRLMIGLGLTDDLSINLFRANSCQYNEMVRLLREATEYWKHQTSHFADPGGSQMIVQYEEARPEQMKKLGLIVNYQTGLIFRKPARKCLKCFQTYHSVWRCPFKKESSRTPEVKAQIEARLEEIKRTEGADPLISKRYRTRIHRIFKRLVGKRKKGEAALESSDDECDDQDDVDES